MDLTVLLIRISQFSSLIPVFVGFLFYKKLNRVFKTLVWILVFSSLVELIAFLLRKYLGNNLPLLHIFTIIEFCMFLYVFYKGVKIKQSLYFLLIAAFILLACFDAFVFNKISTFNSIAKPAESLVFTIVALYYYYYNLQENNTVSIFYQPMYWFSTGILIYFSVNFFMFLLMNTLLSINQGMGYLEYNIHSISNIIANLLFAISFTRFNARFK